MQITKIDIAVFVYNFALVLSGGYAVLVFSIQDRPVLFASVFVLAAFWTVYFRLSMQSRLLNLRSGPADDETRES